jgi:hypothetical protein
MIEFIRGIRTPLLTTSSPASIRTLPAADRAGGRESGLPRRDMIAAGSSVIGAGRWQLWEGRGMPGNGGVARHPVQPACDSAPQSRSSRRRHSNRREAQRTVSL